MTALARTPHKDPRAPQNLVPVGGLERDYDTGSVTSNSSTSPSVRPQQHNLSIIEVACR
jgi:hypothetical protein